MTLSIERVKIAIADLPSVLHGTKIVQLSDLHYDKYCLSDNLLAKAIEVTNREKPDLIVLTGDYVCDRPEPIHKLVTRLQKLHSRLGIYACLGNHDLYYLRSRPTITKALQRVDIRVLWNEIVYPFGREFPVVGLADFWSPEFAPQAVMNQLDPQQPRLVLSHNPDTAEILQSWRVDLQLSGHTHGGQWVLPGYGPIPQALPWLRENAPQPLQKWMPFVRKCSRVFQHWEWSQGYHRIGDNQLYVNRGLGSYFPGRFLCPPEVTAITIEAG